MRLAASPQFDGSSEGSVVVFSYFVLKQPDLTMIISFCHVSISMVLTKPGRGFVKVLIRGL